MFKSERVTREDMAIQWAVENDPEMWFLDGKYIGHCSLSGFDSIARCCELGIEIGDKAYWGKGYGLEVIGVLRP